MKRYIASIILVAMLGSLLLGCQSATSTLENIIETMGQEVQTTDSIEETKELAADVESTVAATEATAEVSMQTGIRADFKEAMDSYEAFFKSYCEFMKKYQDNPTDLGLLVDYAKFMQQYTETMKEMEELKTDDLSNEELSYYLEVNTRITQMLLEVTQ